MAMIQISNLNPAVETESFLVELQATDSDNILGGSNKGHGGKGRGRGRGRNHGNGYCGGYGGGYGHGGGHGRGGDDDGDDD